MGKWLKGCEVCNAGLVVEMDRLIGNGISVNKAAKLLAEEGERKIGDLVYSAAAIRARYRYFKGLREPHPKKVGQSDQPKKKPSTSRESGKKSPKVVNAEKPEPDDEGPYLVTVGGDEGIVIETEDEAIEIEDEDAQEDEPPVKPEMPEFSSIHIRTTAKEASKAAERAKITPLQRIAMHVKAAARGLEAIVEGRVKGEGKFDSLYAASIRRKGPGIIISYYQLGIDPQKAVDFYHGRRSDGTNTIKGKKTDKQANSRNPTAIEDHAKKEK